MTDWESWWRTMIAPILQSLALRKPLITLAEGDYSFFDRAFKAEASQWFKKITGRDDELCGDIGAILRDFSFDAGVNFGLEMVDILTNATRRALNGNLEEEGWADIPKLIPRLRERQRVHLVSFVDIDDTRTLPYARTIRKLDRYGRSLLLPNGEI